MVTRLTATTDSRTSIHRWAHPKRVRPALLDVGILGDPTGVGAPGVPADGEFGDPDVNPRFQSPAMPRAYFGGVKISF